jgi:hypothetical protein
MFKASLKQAGETFKAIRIDSGPECDMLGEKRHDDDSLEVGNHAHADSARSSAGLFDHQDKSLSVLELTASPEASLFTFSPHARS